MCVPWHLGLMMSIWICMHACIWMFSLASSGHEGIRLAHVYMYVCMCMCIFKSWAYRINAYIHTYMHKGRHKYVHAYTYKYVHVHLCTLISQRTNISSLHACLNTYKHTHSQKERIRKCYQYIAIVECTLTWRAYISTCSIQLICMLKYMHTYIRDRERENTYIRECTLT